MSDGKQASSIIFFQPALPSYRYHFFELLHKRYGSRFCLYYSSNDLGILTKEPISAPWAKNIGKIFYFTFDLKIQPGVFFSKINFSDFVFVSGEPKNISTLLLILYCKFIGAKVVWWGHLWSATSKNWSAKMRYKIMNLCDAILFYMDAEMIEYKKCSQTIRHDRIFALNNGINNLEIAHFRASYDPTKRTRDILFISRVTAKVNLDILIDALAHPECCEVCLDIIGDGQDVELLKDYAKKIGLDSRIRWHGSLISEEQIARIANECKIFVYPGAVGLSLIHALNYGLPAIIHDNRHKQMPEHFVLQNGVNGLYFEYNKPSSLANVIHDLLSDPERLQKMSMESIRLTQYNYTTSNMADRISALIESMDVK